MLIPEYSAILEEVTFGAAETKIFRFRTQENPEKKFTFLPGQFVSLRITEKVFRAYSIASSPEELPLFEICAKIFPGGKGSTYLDHLKPGDVITYRGAFGNFQVKNPATDKVFIATGTGIAPIRSFTAEITNDHFSGMHTLVFGVRTQDYAPYTEEFTRLSEKRPDFEFTLCLSRPETSEGRYFAGRVTDWARQKDSSFFSGKDIYICGSPEMVKEIIPLLGEKGVPKEAIFTEAY